MLRSDSAQTPALRKFLSVLGPYKLRKKQEYSFSCPFCQDHKKRMDVNFRKGLWHCYHCGSGGPIRALAEALGIVYTLSLTTAQPSTETPRGGLPPDFLTLEKLRGSVSAQLLSSYFLSRGISYDRMNQMGIGVSLIHPLRVIIPIRMDSKPVYYLARALMDKIEPKELSPVAAPDSPYWPRSSVVYGYDELKRNSLVVLTEGIFDAEAVMRAGYSAVALLGSSVSERQAGLILSKAPTKIVLAVDGDHGAGKMVQSVLEQLSGRFFGPIAVTRTASGIDPDDYSQPDLRALILGAVPALIWYQYAETMGWIWRGRSASSSSSRGTRPRERR